MRKDNGYCNKDYGLLDKYLFITALIDNSTGYELTDNIRVKKESNKRVNSCTQRMMRDDFPLLSHPSLLPVVSQSDKHHKEPTFLHLFRCISFMHHFFITYFGSVYEMEFPWH